MSILGETLAGKHTFVYKDKSYEVQLITQEVKLAFERSLFGRAKAAAVEMRSILTTEEYQEHLRQLNRDYIAGEFMLESGQGMECLNTVCGVVMLCSLLFGVDQATMQAIVLEYQDDVVSLLRLIIAESYPALDQRAPVPSSTKTEEPILKPADKKKV